MFTAIIKNYDTGAEMIRLKVKNFDRPSDLIAPINKALETADLFRTGLGSKVTDLGINAWTQTGNVFDSTNKESFMESRRIPETVKIICGGEKKDTGVKLGFVVYPEGYVIGTGKATYGIFGNRCDTYLCSIGKRNVYSNNISRCHVFPSLKSLLEYVKKHEYEIKFLVSTYGYQFSVDYANDLFRGDAEALPAKKQASESKIWNAIKTIMDTINKTESEGEETALPENPTQSNLFDEADRRMKTLSLWDRVILDYRGGGKVFQSEAGGIIYDLDDNAKSAVKETEDMGLLPYHVIVSHNATIGKMYSVLYVSRDSEEWKYERPDRKGCMRAYVYNADHPEFSELGDIYVEPANGGIVRIY